LNELEKMQGGYFPKKITKDQAKDTGMAMVLICLILGYFLELQYLFTAAIILLLINMIVPLAYQPVAKVWLGLSTILGTIISKVFLSVIFFIMVTPMGMIRKMLGVDVMQTKKWKQNSDSVFKDRNHLFTANDIEKPY